MIHSIDDLMNSAMNILKAITTVAATTILSAIVGGLIGAGLGKIAPTYYLQTLHVRDSNSFNAIEMGLGLGVTQGLIGGIIVGMLIVGFLVWKEIWLAHLARTNDQSS